ncbi:ATP-binding protein [Acetobacter orientalis]|uniref:ATP-binding protein n=1 Tax=Acetobacter orientalis TaxID=146474 RepID=UPI0039E886D9
MNLLSCTVWLVGVGGAAQGRFAGLLRQRGFQVESLPDGASAFAAFENGLPDLLVVPVEMADMTAIHMSQRLRVNAITRGIPIVVLTENADPACEQAVLERGADACFCVQSDPLLFMFRVCTLLREYADDLPLREDVGYHAPSVMVVTAPGGVLWSWAGGTPDTVHAEPQTIAQPAILDWVKQNCQQAALVTNLACLEGPEKAGGQRYPDCVVVDLACPEFDGLALVQRLVVLRRRYRQCSRVLGMVPSGQVVGHKATIAFEAGVDDLVDADISATLLMARIDSLVRRKILQDEMRQEDAHIESARARMALADALRRVNADLAAANRKLIEAQAKLVQSAKMASLGELAAGIAHEFNNPLAFVLAHENTVSRSIARAQEAVQAGDLVVAESALTKSGERLAASLVGLSRMRDLVASLRRFSRLEEGEFARLDVPEALSMVLTLLAPKLGQEIEVVCHLDAPAELLCQAALVNQVVMNIVSNAADAILEKRTAEKEKNIKTPQRDKIEISSCLAASTEKAGQMDYVIRITDTGPGVPETLQERIFEPFFTTKPVGSGTGLGLATAYGVVQAHGGSIVVTNMQQNGGACFTLRVPYTPVEEKRSDNAA